MAMVTDYACLNCGLELKDDGRVFIWDDEKNQTRDFLILMRTYQWLDGAKISGNVSETYCSGCDRYLMIYSITEVLDGISNPCETVRGGIENRIKDLGREIEGLRNLRQNFDYTVEREDSYYVVKIPEWDFSYANIISNATTRQEAIDEALEEFYSQIDGAIESRSKTYEKYMNSNWLIIDERQRADEDPDPLEMVECPVCGKKTHRYVNMQVPCPRCGGELMGGMCTLYD